MAPEAYHEVVDAAMSAGWADRRARLGPDSGDHAMEVVIHYCGQ
jgi:hypothetical protein